MEPRRLRPTGELAFQFGGGKRSEPDHRAQMRRLAPTKSAHQRTGPETGPI
jgi:hypothetical protein